VTPPFRARLAGWLSHPRLFPVSLALALVALAPTLRDGLRMDDRWLRVFARGSLLLPGHERPPHRLFVFLDGNPAEGLRELGVIPWYGDERTRLSFFRPLSSVVHYAEFTLYGDSPWAMHAVSLALYATLAVLVHRLLRRLLAEGALAGPRGVAEAGLAAALYAIDHHHGLCAGWIAQRNSVLAAIFGVLAVGAHDRAARDGERRFVPIAVGLSLASLLSAEAGLATPLAIAAHALTLTPRERLRVTVSPHALPLALWAACYAWGGHGARHSGMYLDLVGEPARAVGLALLHWPLLVSVDLGNLLVDFWAVAGSPVRGATIAIAALVLGLFVRAAAPVVRRCPVARFLALASVLTLAPSAGVLPMSRLVLFSGVFALGLFAHVVLAWLEGEPLPSPTFTRPYLAFALATHLVVGPVALGGTARAMVLLETGYATFARSLPEPPVPGARSFVINAPEIGFFGNLQGLASDLGTGAARGYALANGNRNVTVRREGARAFVLSCEGGFVASTTDAITRSPASALPLGATFPAGPLTLTITRHDAEGRADEARVEAPLPLDDPRYVWLVWRGERLEPVGLPPVGETLSFPAQSAFEHLLRVGRRGDPAP
jgi:hypothetical protein